MNQLNEKILIGVSSCLLGEPVRWNGDHRQNTYIKDVLGRYLDYLPVCPEIEVGMGVPRETVQLVGSGDSPRMQGTRTGTDWTDTMQRYARKRAAELTASRLCGFIFKKGSPSCGMARIPLYRQDGAKLSNAGRGMFAQAVMDRLPVIPLEEEGRLNDPRLRENFIIRVFGYHRLQQFFSKRFSRRELVRFHTDQKLLLLAHSRSHHTRLGQLVANAGGLSTSEIRDGYISTYMQALSYKSTPKKNTDVLMHMLGYFKKLITPAEKQNILQTMEDYRCGWVPLIVPVTLLRHLALRHKITYLMNQVYLNPHPKELMLRNHV